MKKEVIEIQVKTEGAVQSVDKLDKSLKGVKTETKEVGKASNEVGGTLDKMTGGAVSKFKGMLSSVKAVSGGFNLLKVAIIGTGIGALLIAIVAVKAAFTNSEKGQNKYAKLMGVIGSVTGNLVDLLASLGEKIIWVFENPKKAINDFVKLLKENVINRFEGLLELIPSLGKAVSQLFKLDFAGAAETAANAVAKVVLGTENLTKSIRNASEASKKFAKEIEDDAKKAQEIADLREKATKIERGLTVQRAKADRDIAKLRFKSEQRDKFNATERIKFLKDASKISEDIANKEIVANSLRVKAQDAENKLAGSKNVDLQKLEDLKAKGIQLDTAKLNLQKRLQTSLTTFQNEEIAGAKKITDAAQKVIDDAKVISDKKIVDDAKTEKERLDAIDKIQEDYKIKKENDDAETEIQKIELEQTRALAELERLNATEEQKAAAIAYWDGVKKEQGIKDAKDEADAKIKIAELETKAKNDALNSYGNALGAISGLVGKETAAGKAAAIASTTISTYLAAQKAYESQLLIPTPDAPIRAALAAGVAVASGLANVKAILSVKTPNGGGAGGSVQTPQQAQAPQFNVVGTSGTNQLASAIGGQTQEPVKAYVVSNDVTTQQSLDRNIVDNATFG